MSKGYIKIIFSLLISSVCMGNKGLAAEDNSDIETLRRFARSPTIRSTFPNEYPEGTSEKAPFNISIGPKEIKIAEQLMDEAELLLQQHAVNKNGYKLYNKHEDSIEHYKKDKDTIIYKFNHKIKNPDKYDDIIDVLWNPNIKYFGDRMIKEKIVCQYSPNLMMILHRYKNDAISFHGYYYALAKKVQVSDDTTIIVYTSSDINDYNKVDKRKYTNTIVESANLFKPRIYSEKDIINGELKKMFVNLSGFIIKKKPDFVDITYIDSITINTPIIGNLLTEIIHSAQVQNIMRLSAIISKE
ncbi:hypothetical protein, variant [Plasmodium yoelii 17X]|uniref:Fam-a protein n=4 Tax=Plasmodium yoelii TaxID=5861 RepID=A0AAF0B3M7_PLAYO|nr:uncharacterized protein PY17X_0700700 [Plasmodium yoelii]EAA22322.1 93 kDa protein [Plasmodium yoelii yoelii]ETB62115.1 hypothetical protein YYC_01116 [Plasmodium yoelii 17X]ETB62116.1 hypothetical protein, variant [Plasmodium yoelii 17X]WBY56219.1 fam-a protein [Plasmodium yoelii yoelii]CDU17126.1 fam-a protein [Plasmodium yoelii]|eukprot:XP_730757.1 uncharacterized protein PY17X_0700700 [Plasmodium yoelii]